MLTETPLITEATDVVANLETRYSPAAPTDGAPVLVFLHDGAWGGASDVTWGEILPLAAEKFRVIAPDLLGYGGSAKSIRVGRLALRVPPDPPVSPCWTTWASPNRCTWSAIPSAAR